MSQRQTQQLQQIITLTLQGNQTMASQIKAMEKGFDDLGKSVDKMGNKIARSMRKARKQTKDTTTQTRSGLANVQAGLVQLSTWLLNTNVKINNTFDNMKKRFTEAETAMTQLKITMGKAGLTEKKDLLDYTKAHDQINLLARTTQFTKKEVADAVKDLVQSGKSIDQAKDMITSVLQFTTAAGGSLSLSEAIDVASLSIGTLGGKVEDVENNLNMLLKTSQKTRIGFTELGQVMASLRGASSAFADTGEVGGVEVSREAQIMALAAAARAKGERGRGVGQKVDQFAGSLMNLVSIVSLNKLRAKEGVTGKGRFKFNRAALLQFLGIPSINELRKEHNKTKQDLEIMRDQLAKQKLMTFPEGKVPMKKNLLELVEVFTKSMDELERKKGGEADSIIKKAFGTASAPFILKGLRTMAKESKKTTFEYYRDLAATIDKNNHEMLKADEEAKKTIAYRTKVLESAISSLSNTIFAQDIVAMSALDTYKETISAIDNVFQKNKSLSSAVAFLGRTFQVLTSIGTTLGFMLVATATFSTALSFALGSAKVAGTGLMATLGAFSKVFLLPTVVVLGQLAVGLGVVSLGVVAMMKYFSKGKSVGEGFKTLLDKIKSSAMAMGGILNLTFSKQYGSQGMKKTVQEYYKSVDRLKQINIDLANSEIKTNRKKKLEDEKYALDKQISKMKGVMGDSGSVGFQALGEQNRELVASLGATVDVIKDIVLGIKTVADAALGPLMMGIGLSFEMIDYALNIVLVGFRALGFVFGTLGEEGKPMIYLLKTIGFLLGAILSFKLLRFVFMNSIVNPLKMVKDGFVKASASVNSYAHNVGRRSNYVKQQLQGQMNSIQKLDVGYHILRNNTEKYKASVDRARNGTNLFSESMTRLKSRTDATWGAMKRAGQNAGKMTMALGGASSALGYLFTLSPDPLINGLGNVLLLIGSITFALSALSSTVLPALGKAFKALGLASYPFLVKLLVIATAILALIYAVNEAIKYFSNNKTDLLKSIKGFGMSSAHGATMPDVTNTGSFGSPEGTAFGGGSDVVTGNYTAPTIPSVPTRTTAVQRVQNTDNRTVINLDKVTVVANEPVQLVQKMKKIATQGTSTGGSFAYG